MEDQYPTLKVKAGRFTFDPETKKVRVCKDKGLLSFFTNGQQENHVSWVNTDKNLEEIDIIVFPFDTRFEQVTGQKNTFVLRFDSNDDRYFFYLQEKIDPQQFVDNVKQRLEFTSEESMEIEEKEVPQEKPQKMEIQEPVKEEKKPQLPELKGFSPDFLARLTNNLMAASKKENNDVTHLSKILTPETITAFLSELTQEQKHSLLEFLPQEQKSVDNIAQNVRSPQFQQSADTLSDALNSENVFPLFIEMGLDQKHLKHHYGVHAFLLALQEWATKQEKKDN